MTDNDISKKEMPLVGCNNNTTYVIGIVVLKVMVIASITMMNFMVIDVPINYNTIHRRPWIHKIKVIISTYHQVIKYLT